MVYRKGELTDAIVLRDWPHHVLIRIPEGGLGTRLDAMTDFCRGLDYKTAGALKLARSRGLRDTMWWCFRSEADANAFRTRFADLVAD
jgi:hypothetical protein